MKGSEVGDGGAYGLKLAEEMVRYGGWSRRVRLDGGREVVE